MGGGELAKPEVLCVLSVGKTCVAKDGVRET
jgi:hypothetical protein